MKLTWRESCFPFKCNISQLSPNEKAWAKANLLLDQVVLEVWSCDPQHQHYMETWKCKFSGPPQPDSLRNSGVGLSNTSPHTPSRWFSIWEPLFWRQVGRDVSGLGEADLRRDPTHTDLSSQPQFHPLQNRKITTSVVRLFWCYQYIQSTQNISSC